ncbi:MAG: MFS transporter, partial [Lentisphaerae bacterium]|nr:MFS transporter [Lentisphaerota bacterium]
MLNHYSSQQTNLLRALRSRFGKTAVIYPAALLVAMGMGCNMLGLVFYARERYGASPSQIGYLAGCWSISYMVGCLLLRPLSRRLLPRFSILGATALMAVAAWCMLITRSLAWLFVLQCCLGLIVSFFWPPLMGWLSANVEGTKLNRSMGWFNISWSTGSIISPLLAGSLSEMAVDLPLRAAGTCFLAAALLILGAVLTLSSLADDDHAHTAEQSATGGEDSGTSLRFPAWMGIFTSYLVLSVMLNVFPLVARLELGLSKTLIGLLLFLRALVGTASLGILGKTSWWHFKGRPIFERRIRLDQAVFLRMC